MKEKIYTILGVIKNFIINNLDIIFFIPIILYKLVNYEKIISPEYFTYHFIVPPVLSSIIIVASFSLLFKNKGRMRFLYIFDIVISIIVIADAAYYRYFKDIISISVIRNGVMLGGVSSSLKDVLYPTDFLNLLDCFILLPIMGLYKKRIKRPQLKFVPRLAFFLVFFCIGTAWDAQKISSLNKEQPGLIANMSSRLYLDKYLGDLNFHVLDAYNVASTKVTNMKAISTEKQDKIKAYLDEKDAPQGVTFKNIGNGKNLIVLQVEALQQFVINKQVNGQEITPNLNKWIGKSMYFNNYYYQVASGTTSDAEFLSLNSLYPAATGAAYYMYPGNTYDSIPKQFNNKGYTSVAYNGYQEGFWNRNVMYKAEDFSNYYAEKSYNMNEQVGLGLSDKSFFNQTVPRIENLKQPYYSFLITLSSHFPYDDQKGYGNTLNLGKYKGTFIGDYLNGIHYTDTQIGTFLDKLDKDGVLKNSILVVYGDHYAIPKNESQGMYDFLGIKNASDLDWNNLQKVPLMIHFPNDANKGVNNIPAGQIDLYPTLANIFGLNNKYMFGTDLLNDKTNVVKFRNGSFVDKNYFYASYTNTYYDIKTGKAVKPNAYLTGLKNKTITELEYNDDILNHNLLKKFIKQDSSKK
ncbi:MAG: LTA synthase family protein [Clostridium sp.]|nr:LTA synthase family protein [Clostridium sp.]